MNQTVILINFKNSSQVDPWAIIFRNDFSKISFKPWVQVMELFFVVENTNKHFSYFPRIIVRNICAPTSSNSMGAIDKSHRNDGNIELGLHYLTIILNVFQSMVIFFFENLSCYFVQTSEDVSCWGMVLSTLIPWTELAIWHQQIDVIGTHETLSHSNNCLS